MKPVNWAQHRRADGTIDLSAALKAARADEKPLAFPEVADAYLGQVEAFQPIFSRQAAALALLEAEKRGQEGQR